MDKDHILSEIKRTTEENNGRPLGIARFQQETGIKSWDWRGKFWATWGDAIAEAGYENPNTMQSAYTDDFLIQKLIELIHELGHFPTSTERRLKGNQDKVFPSHNTFARFGSKGDLIQAVLKYCHARDINPSVIDICKGAAVEAKPRHRKATKSEDIEYGFVYLMKSGRNFKIEIGVKA